MTILKMNYKYPLFERIITNCLAEEIQEIKFVFLKTLPSTLERIFLDTASLQEYLAGHNCSLEAFCFGRKNFLLGANTFCSLWPARIFASQNEKLSRNKFYP